MPPNQLFVSRVGAVRAQEEQSRAQELVVGRAALQSRRALISQLRFSLSPRRHKERRTHRIPPRRLWGPSCVHEEAASGLGEQQRVGEAARRLERRRIADRTAKCERGERVDALGRGGVSRACVLSGRTPGMEGFGGGHGSREDLLGPGGLAA